MLKSFVMGFRRSTEGWTAALSLAVFLAPLPLVFTAGGRLPLGDPGEVVKVIYEAVNPVVPMSALSMLSILPLFFALLVGAYSTKDGSLNVPSRFAYLLGRFTGHATVLSAASFASVLLGFLILVHFGAAFSENLLRTVLTTGALFSLVAVQLLALGYLISTLSEEGSVRLVTALSVGFVLLIMIPMAVMFLFMLKYAPMGELVKSPVVIREETWRYLTLYLPFEPTLQMGEALAEMGTWRALLNVLNLGVFPVVYVVIAALRFSRGNGPCSP
ncbi:ABC transporter permease subunit [Thermococcus sp.]